MIKHAPALVLVTATAFALAACSSGGSSGSSAARSRLAEISAATHPSPTSSAPAGPTIDLAGVDVCALLSSAEANRVAHAQMFDEFQTAATVYTFTATKQPGSDPSCKFRISDQDDEGTVVFRVQSAAGFVVPPDGQTINGLGDQAYDTGVSPVVRVGNVMISSDDNSFPDSFTVALLRTMVPKLK